MNILPKKRWHVRTRENIARVRRDEAKAAEEEQSRQERIKLAEREARRAFLLNKNKDSSHKNPPDEDKNTLQAQAGHINFFQELEQGIADSKKRNHEHDKEQKEEREKYEKQIGYLTYLGQDTNEALGKKSWYDIAPNRNEIKGETDLKCKLREDPLQTIKKHTGYKKKQVEPKFVDRTSTKPTFNQSLINKSEYRENSSCKMPEKSVLNKHKHKTSCSSDNSEGGSPKKQKTDTIHQNLQILRMKRLEREKEERKKANLLLSKLKKTQSVEEESPKPETFQAKYNSQFNPHIARQNYSS
ncbi:unnamed protein product [Phaedon cochleariae]|uniref:CBF1-interacting co-repressor CIR N-terminal domain-containing protein n=1 Tax=Phaedon cochleariae TaxID=80249 RepID=A0A9N9SFZ4_PHACE|nr:unnamed protein product [Phaedon cochleariae]